MHKPPPSARHYRCGCAMVTAHPACPAHLSPENKDALAASGQHKSPECGALPQAGAPRDLEATELAEICNINGPNVPVCISRLWRSYIKPVGQRVLKAKCLQLPLCCGCSPSKDSTGEGADSNGGGGKGTQRLSGPKRGVRSSQI